MSTSSPSAPTDKLEQIAVQISDANVNKIKLVRLSCNSRYAVTYNCDGQLVVWEINNNDVFQKFRLEEKAPSVEDINDIFLDISPDGRFIAFAVFNHDSASPSLRIYSQSHIVPGHMKNLQGHGIFCSPELYTQAFVLITFFKDYSIVKVYDIYNCWTIIKHFYIPNQSTKPDIGFKNPNPSTSHPQTSLVIRFSNYQRFVHHGLARAISQGSFILPVEHEKGWGYSLQSWSIFDGSPQVTADLRVISETIPVTSRNKQYRAICMGSTIYVVSAMSGCEIASMEVPDITKWEPVAFIGIGDQWLALRGQLGECSVWQFNHSEKKLIPLTLLSSSLATLEEIPPLIATTAHSYPFLFHVRVAASGHRLMIEPLVEDIHSSPQNKEFYDEGVNMDISEYEPWITKRSKKSGLLIYLENPKRKVIIGRSTVQMYNADEALVFIWTLPNRSHIIHHAKISREGEELIIETTDTNNPDLNSMIIMHIPQCHKLEAVAETKTEVELYSEYEFELNAKIKTKPEINIKTESKTKTDTKTEAEALYVSSSLLNSLIYLSDIKFNPWERKRIRINAHGITFASDFFISALINHVDNRIRKHPSMLFHIIRRFFVNWRLLRDPKSFSNSLGDSYIFALKPYSSTVKIPKFDRPLVKQIEEAYTPALDSTEGSSILSMAIGEHDVDLIRRLIYFVIGRTKTTGNIGYIAPITGVFAHILIMNPQAVISAMNDVGYIEAGSFEGISEDFTTLPAFTTVMTYTRLIHLGIYIQKLMVTYNEFFGGIWEIMQKCLLPFVKNLLGSRQWTAQRRYKRFIFPLPNLCVYYNTKSEGWPSFTEWFFPCSPFTEICSINKAHVFDIPLLKGLIKFKWHTFAKIRFYAIFILHILVLGLFNYIISPINQSQTDGSPAVVGMNIFIQIMCYFFLITEVRKMIYCYCSRYYRWRYFSSPGNIITLAAYGMVLVALHPGLQITTNVQLSTDSELFLEVKSVAILLIWIRFLFHMQTYQFIGTYTFLFSSVIYSILPFLCIIVIVVVGLSQALWVLLANTPDPNHFQNYWNSTKYTFLALTQAYDGFAEIDGQYRLVDAYRALFALFMGIIFFNIMIAALSGRYQNSFEFSESVYYMHMGRLISEIEIFFMLPWERRNASIFPRDLIYQIEENKVDIYRKNLMDGMVDESKKKDFFPGGLEDNDNLSFEKQMAILEKKLELERTKQNSLSFENQMALLEKKIELEKLKQKTQEMRKGKNRISDEGSDNDETGYSL